ncbi:MAG TPA: alpha-glucan family phosphorylase [Gemmatimonadaceae bacterium]|nr:alpha-glucan family phosphorylase [Gemmatimonadaceae bacterium]
MSAAFDRPLPAALTRLRDLAGDLRWTWSHTADSLWRTVDPVIWERSENPWSILQNVGHDRLEQLATDAKFLDELGRLDDARQRYLREPGWFGDAHPDRPLRRVAYFCMEFGLAEALPLYAGGLGVLAGDFLKASSDLGIPVVGVGLLYQEGFFRQMIDETGRQQEVFPFNDPTTLPIEPVLTAGGEWLRVPLAFPGRTLRVRVWQARVGRVTLYLLDTNDPLNSPVDRGITGKLYQGSTLVRFLQQVVLGIAGWRALVALGHEVDICHLNEGHAAFAILERAREYMRQTGLSFQEALWVTRAGNVFTTHTPVDDAFDRFDVATVASFRPFIREYVAALGIDVADLLTLGRANPADETEPFRPAYLAIRGSASVNGVSRLHGQVSRRLFGGLFPRWPVPEVPVGHVTNGIHVPSWDSPNVDALWEGACGKERWRGALEDVGESVRCVTNQRLWETKGKDRERLVHVVRTRLARQLGFRGADASLVARAAHVFDANTLTLGFARRFASYKRPALLLEDPDRLERLLTRRDRPAQIVVAGKAHPDDAAGRALITAWIGFAARPAVRDHVVFLEDYDITLAEEMVRGVDLWLNTPRRPWEACGTSGMKVLANGGLNASTLDGWWAEAYDPRVGWQIGGDDDSARPPEDAADASRLYELLEEEIIPEFYTRDATGVPAHWLERVRASMAELAPRFSANRMVREYVTHAYLPGASLLRQRTCDNGRLGKELVAWHARVTRDWHAIHFGALEVSEAGGHRTMAVPVYLGALDPGDVAVELYADPVDSTGPERLTMKRVSELPGAVNGGRYEAAIDGARPTSDYTPRVVPRHPNARVPIEAWQILWYR